MRTSDRGTPHPLSATRRCRWEGVPTALPLLPLQVIFGMELVIFLVLILLIPLVLFILVAVWMYRDANARGMNGGIWVAILILASLIGSFVGGLIVLIVYLLLREGHLGARPYPYGYAYPPPGYGYSGYPPQGPPPAAPPGSTNRCPRCGAALNPAARFCPSCGFQVKA